jgi:hypothetical protein
LEKVIWGEYRIEELFEKLNLNFKKKIFNKEEDISRVKTDEFNLPLVNAKNGDNGIMYYGRPEDFESAEMSIDIVNDGAISTGNVYAQPQKTGVLYNAYLVKPKFSANEKLLHFFTSTIQKSIKPKFGYENKAGWEKVKNEKIQLPTKNGKIDFEFMEHCIAELEAYLSITGLKDYTLTAEEERVLREFENGKFEWGEFRLGELFEKIKTNKLPLKTSEIPKEQTSEYTLPCLTSSFQNQGLNYFVPRDGATILKNVISIPSNSDIYRAYFQSREFTVLSDAYAINWVYDNVKLSPKQYLFTIPCINKVTDLKIYSYKNKLGGWNVVKNMALDKENYLLTLVAYD